MPKHIQSQRSVLFCRLHTENHRPGVIPQKLPANRRGPNACKKTEVALL